jgi:hypothetical protein
MIISFFIVYAFLMRNLGNEIIFIVSLMAFLEASQQQKITYEKNNIDIYSHVGLCICIRTRKAGINRYSKECSNPVGNDYQCQQGRRR